MIAFLLKNELQQESRALMLDMRRSKSSQSLNHVIKLTQKKISRCYSEFDCKGVKMKNPLETFAKKLGTAGCCTLLTCIRDIWRHCIFAAVDITFGQFEFLGQVSYFSSIALYDNALQWTFNKSTF